MIRIALFFLAFVFFVLAIISVPTPLPIGIIFFAIGMAIIISVSETARNKIRNLRERFPGLDGNLIKVERFLPGPLRRALQSSAPDRFYSSDEGGI